ncbi:toprim domain-containing protein [Candidatus Parvarchaeota archaeon]|nr:toprim domain-containing protein [Candidatus Parvarchaeota archaeon]
MVKQGLAQIIDSIKEDSGDSVILVEGRRDKEALKKAGIPDYAILQVSYKDENRIYNEVMLYHRNKIIALYDNDRTGERKMSKLKSFLYGMGLKLLDYRSSLNENGITYIEEIDNRLGL